MSHATCAKEGAFGSTVSLLALDDRHGAPWFDEKAPMANGLDGQKHAVKENREQRKEERLHLRQRRVGRGPREVRQNERDDRERHDQSEIRRRPLQIVILLVVPETAKQQRQADDPVQDDHQEGEHGIPPERRRGIRGKHHGGDERDLDRDDRERQDQRAQRLAEQLGKMISALDHAEGAPRDDREQPQEQRR